MAGKRKPPSGDLPLELPFPLRGVDLSAAYGAQRKLTTPVGNNVRAYEPRTNRARGGSRSGLTKYATTQVSGSNLIQDLMTVAYAAAGSVGTGGQTKTTKYAVGYHFLSGTVTPTFAVTLNGNALQNGADLVTLPWRVVGNGITYVGVLMGTSDAVALGDTEVNGVEQSSGQVDAAMQTLTPAMGHTATLACSTSVDGSTFFTAGANSFLMTQGVIQPGMPQDNFTVRFGFVELDWNGTSWLANGTGSTRDVALSGNWGSYTFPFTI